jgi:glycosyltransferase involved in cell wall biosynthesis
VVIPTYNAADFIRRTLNSVLAQGYDNLEVLVIDDGSADGTADIVATYADPVRLIRQLNAGVSAARNRALVEATGQLVAFLDHDDVWYPGKLNQQVELITSRPEVGLVYGNSALIDRHDRYLWTYLASHRMHRGEVLVPLFLDCFIPLLTVVMRTQILRKIGGFRVRWSIAEDYDIFLKVAELSDVDFVDAIVAGYRVHEGNLSRDLDRRLKEEREVLNACLSRNRDLRERVGARAVRLRMAGLRCEPGHADLLKGRIGSAQRYFGGRMASQVLVAALMYGAGAMGPAAVRTARVGYRAVRARVPARNH